MENFSNKFLAGFIIDLVDGIWREDEFAEKFGFNEQQAHQMWKVIELLRKDNQ